jgi:hypothetical protein
LPRFFSSASLHSPLPLRDAIPLLTTVIRT